MFINIYFILLFISTYGPFFIQIKILLWGIAVLIGDLNVTKNLRETFVNSKKIL